MGPRPPGRTRSLATEGGRGPTERAASDGEYPIGSSAVHCYARPGRTAHLGQILPLSRIKPPPRIFHLETASSTAFLLAADKVLPRRVFDFLTALGVAVAVVLLRGPRRNSCCYLTAILGRPPTLREIWRHYLEFITMHMLRLRVAAGRTHRCHPLPGCEAFIALMESGRPALLGSFHIGNSDLLGFFLGQFRHPVYMVRFRLGDPLFLRKIADKFSAWVSFIWVNEKEDLLFALKHAAQSEGSIAMKCDRVDFSAKLETFDFLGARRSFPFTIYHLGILFQRPVAFCVSSPAGPDESAVHGFPVFEPDSGSKKMNLDRARAHFQLVLTGIESLLRAKPYLWFNFALFHPAATVAHSPIMSPRPATPLSRLPDVA